MNNVNDIFPKGDGMIRDYSAVLDEKYGKLGSPEREAFLDEARAFYTGQLIRDSRRDAKITQAELAARLHVTKSYISRIENGIITPSVTVFYRIIEALGLRVEIVKPVAAF